MISELKDKAKREQLRKLIAMLSEHMDYDSEDQEKDDREYTDRVLREKEEGKGDEYREESSDEHPMEDLREDEDRHHAKYEKLRDDLDADADDHREDEEYDIRSSLKEFLAGNKLPPEMAMKKSKVMMFSPLGKMEGSKKRGRKKKA